jgi:DNA repair exonuclease SbcCD nuclease subunit
VVHAGDVFHRPQVPPSLAYQALEPLARVAERGVPVFIVPGNHERSRLPHGRFAMHRNVHVFDRARTFVMEVRGRTVALSGFPFERRDVRTRFAELLDESGWRQERAGLRLLCMHQCVEGATVGPGDFTFTSAPDVIRSCDIPAGFAAVLSGHIHRHQALTHDLRGRPLSAPVLYPGSLERLSIAEMGEPKGYIVLHVAEGEGGGSVRWEFRQVPTRPMIVRELDTSGMSPAALEEAVRAAVAAAPRDAVLRIRIASELSSAHLAVVSAARMRGFAPESMNVEIRTAFGPVGAPHPVVRTGRLSRRGRVDANHQLEL